MKKVIDFIKNKKIIFIIGAAVLVLGVLITLVCIFFGKNSEKKAEKELHNMLNEIGKDFYENYWYDGLKDEEKQEILERLSITGFHINLENLGRYNSKLNEEKLKEFHNPKGEECNMTNTKIIIYPNSPYGKKDYTLETVLSCGFEDDKKEE